MKDWTRETTLMGAVHVNPQCSAERYTLDEWQAAALKRFGPDPDDWLFICPGCNSVQSRADFKKLGMPHRQSDQIVGYSCIKRWHDQSCKHTGGPVQLTISPGEIRPTFPFAP